MFYLSFIYVSLRGKKKLKVKIRFLVRYDFHSYLIPFLHNSPSFLMIKYFKVSRNNFVLQYRTRWNINTITMHCNDNHRTLN